MAVDVRDVAAGLWLWRQPHWEWREGVDWEPEVSSFVVESREQTVLLDPLAPPPTAREVYERLDARPPTAVVVLKTDHVRDVDVFVHWYGAAAYGPHLFWGGQAPRTKLTPVRPGDELPGGLQALYDGRGSTETPLYLPEQRALVFADGMTAPGGVLRVWWSPVLEQGGSRTSSTKSDRCAPDGVNRGCPRVVSESNNCSGSDRCTAPAGSGKRARGGEFVHHEWLSRALC